MTAIPLTYEAEEAATPNADDERFWSVTTILKTVGGNEGLVIWSAEETAKAAVTKAEVWQAIQKTDGDDAAVAWLREARFSKPKGERNATTLGTAAHACFERWVVTGERPTPGTFLGDDLGMVDAELEPYLDSFDMFLDRFQPDYQAAEVVVYDTIYGYAGQADGFATIDGTPFIIDYKTSKKSTDGRGKRRKPFADVGLQLAAYRHAQMAAVWRARRYEQYSRRYYLLSPEEKALAQPVPQVDGGLVVHITPHHCDVYPVRCGTDVHEAFLYTIEAARWSFELSRDVIGKPLALLDTPQPS